MIQSQHKLDHRRQIAIIGLGYVGLPLAIEFGKQYDVLGFDINQDVLKNSVTARTAPRRLISKI